MQGGGGGGGGGGGVGCWGYRIEIFVVGANVCFSVKLRSIPYYAS